MSQFNFYQNKNDNKCEKNEKNEKNEENEKNAGNNDKKTKKIQKAKNPREIKANILDQYDLYFRLLRDDDHLKKLIQERQKHSNEFLKWYALIQSKDKQWTDDEVRVVNIKLEECDQNHKNSNDMYHKYLQTQLHWLKSHYPEVYDMITDRDPPPNRKTLENVLDAYCQNQSGQITRKDAIAKGLNYITETNKLPKDFFDLSQIEAWDKKNRGAIR